MRAFLLVLDSVGVGHAPDADAYGDTGANTLGHILEKKPGLKLPHLQRMGLSAALRLAAGQQVEEWPKELAVGVMTERSAGKDTTTGHWELAGVVLKEAFPVFEKFPEELVRGIEEEADVEFLGNYAASGTVILDELGEEHVRTGKPILYTSADSVLQIAAHEEVIPVQRLYEICKIARKHADAWKIGRVIARPFRGEGKGKFQRTSNRHDFSFLPPPTILDALKEEGKRVVSVGKIADIFADQGITESHPTRNNAHGMEVLTELCGKVEEGLIFANLVDFDMLYGHRRDVEGYAAALAEFDAWLGGFFESVPREDLLIITADHGNDPTHSGTDHTRERVPLFVRCGELKGSLGQRDGYSDVAASVAQFFGVRWNGPGRSFLA